MRARSLWLDAQAARDPVHFDRGISRFVAEQSRAVRALAPDLVQEVSLDPAAPAPAELPSVYHVMSPIALDRSLAQVWPEWARTPATRTVVTLFDLIPLVFADRYLTEPLLRARYEARLNLVRGADHVLAISEATAADAVERLGLRRERMTIIDAGARALTAPAPGAAPPAGVRDGYMLYVSGTDFRKNNERLIEAYGLMDPDLRRRHRLVITCSLTAPQRAHLERAAADAGLAPGEVVLTGYVSDAELAGLYRTARLFVFASIYEGSGLPILEAMAAGLPVAAARASTTPEVLGDLDATFDPSDPRDIARVVTATVADDAALERLRRRSRDRARHYTWERVARRTLDGYAAALRDGTRRAPRPRLAVHTPWPPERSPVADHGARLAPELARHAEVDVVIDAPAGERSEGLDVVTEKAFASWRAAARAPDRELRLARSAHAELPYAFPETDRERAAWRDVPLILYVGPLRDGRGLETLIAAFGRLVRSHPTAQLILAGPDAEPGGSRWGDVVRAAGLEERVQMPGDIPAEQCDLLRTQATVAVQLTDEPSGETCAAVARHVSLGLPAIVTAEGWLGELPGDVVVHVPRGVGAERLAAELERLIADEPRATAIATAAVAFAATRSYRAAARREARATLLDPPAGDPEPLRPARVTLLLGTYNRVERVLLALRSLAAQTVQDFAVVIADQRSTDGTREEILRLARTPRWSGRLLHVDVADGPAGAALPRNRGAEHAAPGTSLLLMYDADILLVPEGIERLLAVHDADPDAAIPCRYDWLAPATLLELERRLDRGDWPGLESLSPKGPFTHVGGTLVGPDPRPAERFAPARAARSEPMEAWLVLGALHAVPAAVFERTGGFDESMGRYGYEDIEHGVRMEQLGVPMVLVSDCLGLHVWHPKPDWEALSELNQQNLDYMLRKHGPLAARDDSADWTVWWHYHSDRLGRVVRVNGDLWAIDRADRFRLALPSPGWVERLGHSTGEVEEIAEGELADLHHAGEAREIGLPRRADWRRPVG
jgi:glycosyltransferase involved in cell wall biosynthesis/GT2 family glycosyltransferase